jgi:glutamate N-acetyltransferase/amino-acid N-acetyltransferase
MATMLAFILTDADVERAVLSRLLREGIAESFNRITVDGDTSTNDMVLVLANGAAGAPPVQPGAEGFEHFKEMLLGTLGHLAQAIVHDAEGVTKVVEIVVRGARTTGEAEQVAFKVAHSPLVKTALFGEDPNWGRIMAAVGNAGVPVNPNTVSISFDDALIVRDGMEDGTHSNEILRDVLKKKQFRILIDLHQGMGERSVLTTDLSYEYVRINASYRT